MAPPTALSKSNTSFALALFKELADNDRAANIFYSPFSISSALAMVLMGAGGNTATQMSQCMKVKGSKDSINTSFRQLLESLHQQDAPYTLSVANRLYGEKSYKFVEKFLEDARKHYKAELESVDFQTAAEESRIRINSWVEKQTEGKIKDLLIKGLVTSDTRLVLVNAIYFKGKWKKQFKEDATRDAPFHISKTLSKPVKMMQQKSKFPFTFIPEANCQILELPYIGEELSMLILLPYQKEDNTADLEKLEKMLTYDKLMEWTDPKLMDVVEVQVGLPRFKLEGQFNMKNVLMKLGMVDAFDVAMSDFSDMSTNNDLVLSEVVHKAFVEVNEEGTEAAAATAGLMMLRCAMPTERFYADHPFLFFIRHNSSLSFLFSGRCCSPE